MYESEQRIAMMSLRVVDNALVYAKGNAFKSVEHTGTGEYTITLAEPVDFDEVNIRCVLFGNPVASD